MSTLVMPYPAESPAIPPDLLAQHIVTTSRLAERVVTAGGERQQHEICMPWNGQRLGSVPVCTPEDVEFALERAREGQRIWSRTPYAGRRAVFTRFHDLLLARQSEMMDILQLESGKSRKDALEEVLDVAINSRHYAYHSYRYLKPKRRKGALPLVTQTWEYHHPVGVVGIIAPWNYPLTLTISDAIPAMMAGNTVLLKPAEETPFTALFAMQLMREAGLPYEVFQVVTGRGRDLGPALIQGADFLMFTGSTGVGKKLAQQAAGRLIRYSMELGGKNPALVLPDADLDKAAEGLARGAFSNAGQLCISIERIYVHSSVYEPFLERFVRQVQSLPLGGRLDFSSEIGSLISQDQLVKVQDHVADALAQGAESLTGGRPRKDLGPFFYEPTVLAGVKPGMKVFAEETFGPVVSIYPYETLEEAIQLANDSPYGLNSAIYSRSTGKALRLAQKIETGTVNINEPYAAAWASVSSSMGGMKDSGVSRRHGAEGILKYTEPQTVAIQRFIPLAPFGPLKLRHFAMAMTLILLLIKRIPGLR